MNILETKSNRVLIEARLRPLAGDRFQPTGFADLGAATYQRPDGTQMLLVESAQSMANRLEKTCLDDDGVSLSPDLAGLPYVEVQLTGASKGKASSLSEAHRLNSPFILGGRRAGGSKEFVHELLAAMQFEPGQSPDWHHVAVGLLKYDPCSLIHGLFLANVSKKAMKIEGGDRVRLPRAITAFIDASDVRDVYSGGVKNSRIDPTGTLRVDAVEGDVYSNVPYARREFTAREIKASFSVDVELFRSYRLGDAATRLLLSLSLYKVRRFLDGGMRLRTACDLVPDGDPMVVLPKGDALPTLGVLRELVQATTRDCARSFAEPPVTKLEVEVKRSEKKEGAKKKVAGTDDADAAADDDENEA